MRYALESLNGVFPCKAIPSTKSPVFTLHANGRIPDKALSAGSHHPCFAFKALTYGLFPPRNPHNNIIYYISLSNIAFIVKYFNLTLQFLTMIFLLTTLFACINRRFVIKYNGCARWGVSGALNLQSAIARP